MTPIPMPPSVTQTVSSSHHCPPLDPSATMAHPIISLLSKLSSTLVNYAVPLERSTPYPLHATPNYPILRT